MEDLKLPQFFYDIFDPVLPRLGPGDDACTRRSLQTILDLAGRRGKVKVLDVGCGNGAQTLVLAEHEGVTVLAIDNHEPYLIELIRRAEGSGLQGSIDTRLMNMAEIGPWIGTFDIVWSEGALFVMGFEEGLKKCREVLDAGGFCAATELTWLKPDPPAECSSFFAEEYPAMTDVASNLDAVTRSGFEVVDYFTLPDDAWWTCYYIPLERRIDTLRKENDGDDERQELIDMIAAEVDICRKYQEYYGYVFYLMRR